MGRRALSLIIAGVACVTVLLAAVILDDGDPARPSDHPAITFCPPRLAPCD